jgi:hypothetical protein
MSPTSATWIVSSTGFNGKRASSIVFANAGIAKCAPLEQIGAEGASIGALTARRSSWIGTSGYQHCLPEC